MRTILLPTALAATLLAGCSTVSPDAQREQLSALVGTRVAGAPLDAARLAREPDANAARQIEAWLKAPLGVDEAVRIALLHNPDLQSRLAELQISEADRLQAARLPNPHFAFGRMVEGGSVEIERALRIDLLGLLTLPWRLQWQERQHALAQLLAAQDVIRLAADTRKAWYQAVAAEQSLRYARDAREAAEAAAELARRMVRAGNFSRFRQAREQTLLADAAVQETRARQGAVAAREHLTRLMGLWGPQTGFTLPDRLPDLPAAPEALQDAESRALRDRLDVRAARDESRHVAESLGLTRVTGYINALELGIARNTHFESGGGRDTTRGWELELPLPLFDWGTARNARAEAQYLASAARVREVAVRARSEARESWHAYQAAWDLARYHRDEIVPLHRFLTDETLLRYNGMLLSVWDLLGAARQQAQAVATAIEAQRDFWIADTDLRTALSGTSPGALASLRAGANAPAKATGDH